MNCSHGTNIEFCQECFDKVTIHEGSLDTEDIEVFFERWLSNPRKNLTLAKAVEQFIHEKRHERISYAL